MTTKHNYLNREKIECALTEPFIKVHAAKPFQQYPTLMVPTIANYSNGPNHVGHNTVNAWLTSREWRNLHGYHVWCTYTCMLFKRRVHCLAMFQRSQHKRNVRNFCIKVWSFKLRTTTLSNTNGVAEHTVLKWSQNVGPDNVGSDACFGLNTTLQYSSFV